MGFRTSVVWGCGVGADSSSARNRIAVLPEGRTFVATRAWDSAPIGCVSF